MFTGLAARETFVAEANLTSRAQENVIESSKKHFCFPVANFASEANVSQLGHIRRNNVSQFRQALIVRMLS